MSESPVVSMLWERDDPAETLTKRFGYRTADAVAEWVGNTLDRRWGIAVAGCDRLVISAFNVMAWVTTTEDRALVAKWSARPQIFPRLTDAASVTVWLDSQGLPVAAPIPAIDGRLLVELGHEVNGRRESRLPLPGHRFLLGVLPVVEGDLLDTDDPAQVHDAGRMLARVHEVLAAYPDHFDGCHKPQGQQQLVHNDFRSANILYDGTSITALLDLEEVSYDTCLADLARSAVLLGTRYHDWAPTSESVRDAYVAAYTEHAPLRRAELLELDKRIDAILNAFGWSQ